LELNGEGGDTVTFNIPVNANTMISTRHGGVFNREITVDTILSESRHQDKWEINAGATSPINLIEVNENRGSDGGNTDGYFEINSDLEIINYRHIWGRLKVGTESLVTISKLTYWDYTNQLKNNNINPIELEGDIKTNIVYFYDVENETTTILPEGTYGRLGHPMVDNEVDWIISGDGTIEIIDLVFANSFENIVE